MAEGDRQVRAILGVLITAENIHHDAMEDHATVGQYEAAHRHQVALREVQRILREIEEQIDGVVLREIRRIFGQDVG